MAERDEQARAVASGEGSIRISNREIFDMVVQVRDRVAAVENRVDNAFGPEGIMATILKDQVDTRAKVRALELKSYVIMAGLLGAVVAMLRGIGANLATVMPYMGFP